MTVSMPTNIAPAAFYGTGSVCAYATASHRGVERARIESPIISFHRTALHQNCIYMPYNFSRARCRNITLNAAPRTVGMSVIGTFGLQATTGLNVECAAKRGSTTIPDFESAWHGETAGLKEARA